VAAGLSFMVQQVLSFLEYITISTVVAVVVVNF
jgi:hypothetical protein